MLKNAPLPKLLVTIMYVGIVLFFQPVAAQAGGTEVPLYIKYRYEKQTGRKWYDATAERQREFIREIKEKRRVEREVELRKQSIEDLKEANVEHVKQMKRIRKQTLRAAREREKQEKERIKKMRKQALQMKRAEMSRRIQLRKANNR
ncbi:MAG: hypothetical protein K8I00_08265 [Candidatus Omnitrophica bacterium]|nr:hypothetical protein [Candidatus Omnitrophota bacterium]